MTKEVKLCTSCTREGQMIMSCLEVDCKDTPKYIRTSPDNPPASCGANNESRPSIRLGNMAHCCICGTMVRWTQRALDNGTCPCGEKSV